MEGQDYPEDPYQGAAQQWAQVEDLWALEVQWVAPWDLVDQWEDRWVPGDLWATWDLVDPWALEVQWVLEDQWVDLGDLWDQADL